MGEDMSNDPDGPPMDPWEVEQDGEAIEWYAARLPGGAELLEGTDGVQALWRGLVLMVGTGRVRT